MNRTAEWGSFLLLWLDSPTKTDNSYKYMYKHISNCGYNWHIDFLCRKNTNFYTRLFQYFNIRFNSYILRTIKLSVHLYKSWWKRKRERVFSHTSRPQTQLLWYRKDHDLPTFLTSWTSHTYRLWSLYIHVTYNTNHDILQSLHNTQHFHQFLFRQEDNNTHRYFFTILNINQHLKYKSSMII